MFVSIMCFSKCPSKPACRVLLGGEVGGECLHDDGPVQVPAGGDGPADACGHGDTEECSSDRAVTGCHGRNAIVINDN